MFVVRLSGTIVNKSQTLKLESSPSKARAKWFETLQYYLRNDFEWDLGNSATYKAVVHSVPYTAIDLRTPVPIEFLVPRYI